MASNKKKVISLVKNEVNDIKELKLTKLERQSKFYCNCKLCSILAQIKVLNLTIFT